MKATVACLGVVLAGPAAQSAGRSFALSPYVWVPAITTSVETASSSSGLQGLDSGLDGSGRRGDIFAQAVGFPILTILLWRRRLEIPEQNIHRQPKHERNVSTSARRW